MAEVRRLFDGVHGMCTGEAAAGALAGVDEDESDRLQVLSGVREFPMRVKCATLAWHTMNAATKGQTEVSTEDGEGPSA